MSLIEIHGRLGNTALFYTIIMAVWGFWRFFRRKGIESSYWGAALIAFGLYLLQGILGAYLYFSGIGNLIGRTIHILYGVVSLLTLPSIFAFTRGDDSRRTILVYACGFLFLTGILIRSIVTAG